MTTENTDAAVRILTKTIRKLTAQLAEADESIRYEEGKREEAEGRLDNERKRREHADEGRRLAGDRMVDLEERIERALGSLEGTGSAVARVHAARRALRGDA